MDQLAQRLQQERLRRNLTTFELAQRTKIREPYLEALESGSYNVLPAVYVRSFIRTLGNELGIPAPEINRLIAQCLDGEGASTSARSRPPAADSSASSSSEQRRSSPDPLLTFFTEARTHLTQRSSSLVASVVRSSRTRRWIGVGLVVLAAAGWWYWKNSSAEPPQAVPEEIIDITAIDQQDSLILTAVSTDTSELTVTIDGIRSFKSLIVPGTDYRWSAMKRFTISNIFNAGALQFMRDGKPLPIYGKRGEVLRELVITRTEVTASNSSTKMIIAPADTALARRDSIREMRRDSIRAERRKESAVRKAEAKAKRPPKKKIPAKAVSKKRNEPPILRAPERSIR